jgi:hypothetical protein
MRWDSGLMSDDMLRLVTGGVLMVHGVAHVGAIGALLWLRSGRPTGAGSWTAARSWLIPSLATDTAAGIAITFWAVALVGFVFTALAFWGVLLPVDAWRTLGVISALVSAGGIVLFFGTWPIFNTLAALAVNIAVLVAVATNWPPSSVFGL